MINSEARILVQEQGYKRIGEVTAPFSFWTGDGLAQANSLVVEPQKAVKVTFMGGSQLVCSPDIAFRTLLKDDSGERRTKVSDILHYSLVRLNENTFEFDYLDLSCYKYLYRIDSYQLGMLTGLIYTLSAEEGILDIPKVRREAYRELERLLNILQVEYEKTEYYKRADRNKYIIKNQEFLEEVREFLVGESFPESFWKSKPLLSGFLKAVFTFAIIGTEMFSIRANKESSILKEIQQALLLFGINSTYSRGLKVSQLMVFKNSCYRLGNNIGVFNPEILFEGLDFNRFLRYKDKTWMDMLYVKVLRVEPIEEEKLYKLEVDQFMANGVVLKNYGK